MSQENVETVRRLYSAVRFDRTDPASFDVALTAFFEILDPDAQWQPDENDTDPDLLRGHDGIRDFFERHAEPWDEFHWEPSEILDSEDEVVARGEIHARGRDSGVEVKAPYAHRFTFKDGRLVRGQEYLTNPQRALADAGLSE
jgi:uncharacterized protein